MKSKRATKYTSEMEFKNHLESIKVTLMNYLTMEELENYIPEFVSLTWLEGIEQVDDFMKDKNLTRTEMVREMFEGRTLPTALETIRLTFFIEGLDLTNVTHIIRHRMFSFSAQSTDPVTMEGHDILENDAFLENPELLERSRKLAEDANQLYIDALNSGMSFYDARHYQLRAKEAKYFMSGSIKDFISFVKIRLGRLNQPTSDNILALRIRQAIIRAYPFLEKQMPIEEVQWQYIHSINEKMNLNTYPPDSLHRAKLWELDKDYSEAKFSHEKSREEYSHMYRFNKLVRDIILGNEK